jgi:hypothetical protein
VLWREVSVWDRLARKDLYPAADRLDVVLGQPLALAQRFDPVESDAERSRWTDPRRIPVELAGAPVVLRLTPPGVQQTRGSADGLALRRTRKRQRLRRRLAVKVSCTPCRSVSARGKLVVKRRKRIRVFKLKPARKPVRDGSVILRLRIPARARREALKALRRGGRVRARITVTGRSRLGTRLGPVRRTIVLVR